MPFESLGLSLEYDSKGESEPLAEPDTMVESNRLLKATKRMGTSQKLAE